MTGDLDLWHQSTDPGIRLFTSCRDRDWPMPIRAGDAVLEVGSCESDWLQRASATWPETDFTGIDWREGAKVRGRVTRSHGDALLSDAFAPGSFDAIVSLSAIEHFGLGHYAHDPIDADGDIRIVENCWRWLRPGGWLYYDVPYNPHTFAVMEGTSYRTYTRAALAARLSPVEPCRELVAESGDPRIVCDGWPTHQPDDRLRYYVARLFQKPA